MDCMSRYPSVTIAGLTFQERDDNTDLEVTTLTRQSNEKPMPDLTIKEEDDDSEWEIAALVKQSTEKQLAVTWERVKDESQNVPQMKELIELVKKGFPDCRSDIKSCMAEYWRVREGL